MRPHHDFQTTKQATTRLTAWSLDCLGEHLHTAQRCNGPRSTGKVNDPASSRTYATVVHFDHKLGTLAHHMRLVPSVRLAMNVLVCLLQKEPTGRVRVFFQKT